MTVEFALANSADIWNQFIKYPTAENYARCQEQVGDSLYGNYRQNNYGEKVNTPTQKQLIRRFKLYRQFLSLASMGNSYAIELAFQIRPLTDGAAREELDIAIGKTIKSKPYLFLTLLKKYNALEQKDSGSILENYGDEFVDKFDEQIKETDERIRTLGRVKEATLSEVKKKVIEILKKRKSTILEKKTEMGQ